MTITFREYSDLIHYFSINQSSNHIVSLALTLNDTAAAAVADNSRLQQSSGTMVDQSWDILDTMDNVSIAYGSDNSSLSPLGAINDTLLNQTVSVMRRSRSSREIPIWLIPCYSVILIFAVVGNLLVASTLFQNRRMRTITNVFLANLAISDMLLGVLCMPITLVGAYLRHFVFGELVCKLIQFAQAASVAVSSWTLVAISCERYYAICHPLRSRTWQTINHAYKIIGCIWFGSILFMAPIAIFSQLIPTSRQGLRKCREQWPKEAEGYERMYNIILDLALLVFPLGILAIAYILITRTLYSGIKDEKAMIYSHRNNNVGTFSGGAAAGAGAGAGGGAEGGPSHSSSGDVKIYTQVKEDKKSAFNLNMSFRYHIRKNATRSVAGGAPAGNFHCFIVDEKSPKKRQNSTNDTDQNLKGLPTTSSYPRILCNNDTTGNVNDMEAEQIKQEEENNKSQQQQQQHQQKLRSDKQYSISPSSSFQQQQQIQAECNNDIQILPDDSNGISAETAFITPIPNNKCTILAKNSNGRQQQQQVTCMRSSSFKSSNQNGSRTSAGSEDTITSSSHSLNTLHTRFQRQARSHQASSLTSSSLSSSQQQQQQQHNQGVRGTLQSQSQQQQNYHHITATPDVGEKRRLQVSPSLRITESALRRSNLEKNLESKKRVVKMLFVLVLEFFICWTPLYVINTVAMFIGHEIYNYVDYTTISFFQLLAYSSSCCNPITYCFMNASFRRAFVDTFRGIRLNGGNFWHKNSKAATNLSVAGNSIAMGNSCTVVTANTVLDSPRL